MFFHEEFLYHIWDAQHLIDKLTTVSGKPVRVHYQGRWNRDAGADFKDAIIEVAGVKLRGDVEIELETYNWILHKHHENPTFNTTILHVVYEHNGKYDYTISENGSHVEIIEICKLLDRDITKLLQQYHEVKFETPERVCSAFKDLELDNLEQELVEAGISRLESKIKRFKAEHYFADFDQLMFQGLIEASGYSKNKFQMLQLALNIPYRKLIEYYERGMSRDEFIAIWLGSSGLIEKIPKIIPIEQQNKWKQLYAAQRYQNDYYNIEWHLFRIRPVNHPVMRLLQMSELIYGSFSGFLYKIFLKQLSIPKEKLKTTLFLKRFYLSFPFSYALPEEKYHLGKTRMDTMLVNIVLPLVVVYSREKGYLDLEKAVWKIYREIHGLPNNYITEHLHKMMTKEQVKLAKRKAIFQQGLLKIYYEFCQDHACEGCIEHLKKKL